MTNGAFVLSEMIQELSDRDFLTLVEAVANETIRRKGRPNSSLEEFNERNCSSKEVIQK